MSIFFFKTQRCATCKAVEQKLVDKKVTFRVFWADDGKHGSQLAERFAVRSVPTLVVVNKEGMPQERAVGNVECGRFIARCKVAISQRNDVNFDTLLDTQSDM